MKPDDEQRIERYLQGDPATHKEVDGWLRAAAWSFRPRLGADWDDVLQDLRIKLVEMLRAGRFRGDASFRTFLWRVVQHACVDRLRAQERWSWTDLDAATSALEHEGIELPGLADAIARRDLVRRILPRMSADCRDLWAMVLTGLDQAAMAARLGIRTGTVRVRLLRCRKRAAEIRAWLAKVGEKSDNPV